MSAMAVVCVLLLSARFRVSAEPSNPRDRASGASVARNEAAVDDSHGPTVVLSYSKETFGKNPVSSFMYFVPLISTTLVDRETSAKNAQEVGMVSYERKIAAKSFYVACEFEIRGKGFHKNTFDPPGMIAERMGELEKNEPMTHVLDYIKFEGEGSGRIEVRGTIRNATETVTAVDLQFNVRGRKSPVTIGLYDIKPKDGQYRYENRSNELVARVNTLAFRKSDSIPKMGVSVASITRAATRDGFIARVKGAIANLFIKPPKIDTLGNETLLNFGYAIFKQEPEFTFPIAKNIKEDRTIDARTTVRDGFGVSRPQKACGIVCQNFTCCLPHLRVSAAKLRWR
jgi:hypothetical protein